MKFQPEEFLAKLPLPADAKWIDGVSFTTAFRRGAASLELFAPRAKDYQTFHEQDEFYFVVSGTGELVIETERFACRAGDALFVRAGREHRFENFTDDFAVWVVFFD